MTDINTLIEDVNEEEIIMIDFMDGERVGYIERDGDNFVLFDVHGCEISVVDETHLMRNRTYK